MTVLYQGDEKSKTYGWPDGVAAKDPSRYGIVPDPIGVYPAVWHTQVRPGDNNVQGSGNGERCEGLASVLPRCEPLYGREGRTLYTAWDVVYGDGFTPNESDWNNSGQWHNTGTTGATCAVVTPSTRMDLLVCPGKTGKDRYPLILHRESMRRYELVFQWSWSVDPAKGGAAAWVDGVPVVPFAHAATLYQGQSTYPKLGEYRTAQNFVGDSYFHGYRITTTLAEAVAAFTKSAHAEGWARVAGGTPPPPPPPPPPPVDRFAAARAEVEQFRASSPHIAAAFDQTFKALT